MTKDINPDINNLMTPEATQFNDEDQYTWNL